MSKNLENVKDALKKQSLYDYAKTNYPKKVQNIIIPADNAQNHGVVWQELTRLSKLFNYNDFVSHYGVEVADQVLSLVKDIEYSNATEWVNVLSVEEVMKLGYFLQELTLDKISEMSKQLLPKNLTSTMQSLIMINRLSSNRLSDLDQRSDISR